MVKELSARELGAVCRKCIRMEVSDTAALAKENCEIVSMQEKDESLESYFLSLVGGGANA